MQVYMLKYDVGLFFRFLDIAGTAGFAAGGALAAMRKELDGYGVFVIAAVAAAGGGLARDVFIGRIPPLVLTHPHYFGVILLTTSICILLRSSIGRFEGLIVFMDALGLGFFAVVGYEAGRFYGVPWYGSLFLGVVTGTTGGMIKDVLLGEIPTVLRREIYALACILGILCFMVLSATRIPRELNAIVSSAAVFTLRMVSFKKGWHFPVVRHTRSGPG